MGKVAPSFLEYWQKNAWDRDYWETDSKVGKCFVEQRSITMHAIKKILAKNRNTYPVILDACCGTGKITCEISGISKVKKVIAVDINEKNIQTTEFRLNGTKQKVNLVVGDIREWLPEKTDLVVFLDALHHFDEPKTVLKKLNSALKTNGVLVGNCLQRENRVRFLVQRYGLKAVLGVLEEILDGFLTPRSSTRNFLLQKAGLFRLNPFEKDELKSILSDSGFSNIKIEDRDYYWWFQCEKHQNAYESQQ